MKHQTWHLVAVMDPLEVTAHRDKWLLESPSTKTLWFGVSDAHHLMQMELSLLYLHHYEAHLDNVFCPDGTAAIGMRLINSGGYRLGLACKTPPGFSDVEFVTQFVRTQGSPMFLNRTTEAIAMQSMCNAGDVVMGCDNMAKPLV